MTPYSTVSDELIKQRLQDIIDGCEGVTPGPWAYRPDQLDDWGTVRAKKDAEGHAGFVANVRGGRYVSDDEMAIHRRNKTDPYGANAAHIARLDPATVKAMATLALRSLSTGTDAGVREAADKLGWWLSAALDDPKVAPEMKAAINEWFSALEQQPAATQEIMPEDLERTEEEVKRLLGQDKASPGLEVDEVERLLKAYDDETDKLPFGHESRQRGSSSYNWRKHVTAELRTLRQALTGKGA